MKRSMHYVTVPPPVLLGARENLIEINGQRLTLDPDLTDAARDILKRLETGH
jgi:hypothetical protein